MKAFRNTQGQIDFFKFDTDNTYWSDTNPATQFSNVTYSSTGGVIGIGAAGAENLTAMSNFSKQVNYTQTQCGTVNSGSNFPYTRYFGSFNNTARRLLQANREKRFLDHDRSNSTYGGGGTYGTYYSYGYSSYSSYYDYTMYSSYS